ncbi:MAG: endonuclease/exonuclease/phosphatase family protein [Planctomycetota bacterium]|nr:endonuclease/exonuclease/phosphatase family protein [Planctomycetota bacterium]
MVASVPRFASLAKIIFISSCVTASCVLLGMVYDSFAIFTHFICYFLAYSAATAVLTCTTFFARRVWSPSKWRKGAVFVVLVQALVPLSLLIPNSTVDLNNTEKFSVTWMNLHFQAEAVSELVQIVKKQPSDIVVMAEAQTSQLTAAFSDYPFSRKVESASLYVFSKFPLSDVAAVSNDNDRAFLVVEVRVKRRKFTLLAAHTKWPIFSEHAKTLANAAQWAARSENSIVIGDFNSTPWAAPFRRMLRNGDFRHSRQGYGLLNSWHIDSNKYFGLPIDHIMYRGQINNTNFELIETEHSDHSAIRGEYVLAGKLTRKPRD